MSWGRLRFIFWFRFSLFVKEIKCGVAGLLEGKFRVSSFREEVKVEVGFWGFRDCWRGYC